MYPYRDADTNAGLLALGDLLTVLAFVSFGSYYPHGNTDPLHAVYVAVPFLFGWFVVAPLAGAYTAYPSQRNEAFSLLGTWLVAALVGLGLRSTGFFPGSSPPSFGFVMVVVGGGSFLLWRLGIARFIRRLV
jgi:hypothetical protein